jgi:hypothetical protein
MSRRVVVIAAAVAFAAGSGAAFARAPKPAEMPTVEEIYQQAKAAADLRLKNEADQSHDPTKDLIDAYRDKKSKLEDYDKIVDIVNDAKTEKLQGYRRDATQALIVRFSREDEGDPTMRATRRDIALKVLDLMKADAKKDATGLECIERMLYAWWKFKVSTDVKFNVKDKPEVRKKAYDKMKKFLKDEN